MKESKRGPFMKYRVYSMAAVYLGIEP